MIRQPGPLLCLLAAIAMSAFLLDIFIGSVCIPPSDILHMLMGWNTARSGWAEIILVFRLPKAISAATSGAALAISGLLM